jgi:excisionase family DNA binding protein
MQYPGQVECFSIDWNGTMDTTQSTDFCTTREAARMLGISVRTAQLWVENGTLDAWKTEGGHRRISLASVHRVQHSKQPASDTEAVLDKPRFDQLRILVVEDDRLLIRLYKMQIEGWGLPLTLATAHNGIEGLILIGRLSPDLLITDLKMPELDGFGMLRTLARTPYREGMEIVVVTGMEADEIAAAGGLPEDVKVLHKPVHFAELRAHCEQLLARRRELAGQLTRLT